MLSGCNADAINAVAPESAKAFLDRAYNWIDLGVMYSETSEYDGYRKDCSGFVSYVWQLTDHPGDTTYSLAGGPWNADNSVRIDWSQLTPGDAINFPGDPAAGTGHVMLWGGWLNKEHTEICTMEEYDPGHPASFMTHSIYEDWPAEIKTQLPPDPQGGLRPQHHHLHDRGRLARSGREQQRAHRDDLVGRAPRALRPHELPARAPRLDQRSDR